MSNIEPTDVDGDAPTIYIREESTWITCTSGAEDSAAREALDRALEAALAPPHRAPAAEALADDLRRAAVTVTDVEGLADHLAASGYRKRTAS